MRLLRLPLDRVTFVVGVETAAVNVAQVLASNTSKVAAVIAALKAKGVPAAEIQTSQVLLRTSRDEVGRRAQGFRASNRVSVVRRDPSEAGSQLEGRCWRGSQFSGQLPTLRRRLQFPGSRRSRSVSTWCSNSDSRVRPPDAWHVVRSD